MNKQLITILALMLTFSIATDAAPIGRTSPTRTFDSPKINKPIESLRRPIPEASQDNYTFRRWTDANNSASGTIRDLKIELELPQINKTKISYLMEKLKHHFRDRELEIQLASILGSATKQISVPIDASSPDFLIRRPLSSAYDPIVKEVLDRKFAKLSHRIDRDQVLSLSFVSSTDGKEVYNRSIPLVKRLRGRLAERLASGDFDTLDANYFAAARGKSLVIIGHVAMRANGPAFEIRRQDNTFRYVSFKEIDAAARRFEFSIVLLGCDTGEAVSIGTAKKINDVTAIQNLERAMQRRDTSTLRELIVDLSSPDLQFVMGTDRLDDGTLVPFDLADRIEPTSAPDNSDDLHGSQQASYGAAGGGVGGSGGGGAGSGGYGGSGGSLGGSNLNPAGSSGANMATMPLLPTNLHWGQYCDVSDLKLERSKIVFDVLNFVYEKWLVIFGWSLFFWWIVSFSELSRWRASPPSIRAENIYRMMAIGLVYYFYYSAFFNSNFMPTELMMGKTAISPSFWTIIFAAVAIGIPFYAYVYMQKKMPDHLWSRRAMWVVLPIAAMPICLQIVTMVAAANCGIIPLLPLH